MKYCCHIWADTPNCYLDMLDKLQKNVCRTVSPSLAARLKTFAHFWNVTSLSLKCSSKLTELVPLLYPHGRSTRCSKSLHDFSVTIRKRFKFVCVNSCFPGTARPWNSLSPECFPLAYNQNDFNGKVNTQFLSFLHAFHLFLLLFL